MTAKSLISPEVLSLSVTQTGRDAFYLLGEHHIKHLPVVRENKLIGIVSEEDIFNHKIYDPISEYDFGMIRRYFVRENDHLFEIIRVMADNRLTIIPVVDSHDNYLGLITQNDLLSSLARTASFAEQGAILVFEMHRRDYSLANIARFVEEEDAKVLGSYLSSTEDSDMLELTLKINSKETQRVIAALERRGIPVKDTFAAHDDNDYLQERLDSLMNYLNI